MDKARQNIKTSSKRKAASSRPKAASSKPKACSSIKKRPAKKRKRARQIPIGALSAAAIVAGVALLALLMSGRLWHSGDPERGAKVPPGTWKYGIDISHNNGGSVVWDSLYVMTDSHRRTVRDPYKAKDIKPVSFVFIKATEGVEFRDEAFRENWKNAGHAGIKKGAYHFFRSSKDGKKQAENFIKTVGPIPIKDLPPVLDIETIHRGCSRKLLNERALQWLDTVGKHYGRKPIVYSGASFMRDYLDKEITDNYPIWVAHYGKDRPGRDEWDYWQFTDKALVHGVSGLVDLSVAVP